MNNKKCLKAQILSALLLTLVLLITACGGKKPAENETLPPAESSTASVTAAPETTPAESTPAPVRLSFSEKDIHTGDLILVNNSYPFDFEANEATLDIKNIRENQSFYYQVDKLEFSVAGRILPHLDAMIAACDEAIGTKETGITSAYRTKEYQQGVMEEITAA